MSELKEYLRPAQLIKHYELLQYLSKHPNTTFTLGELDYVLPHGASLQRFPLEWIEYMAHGGCANRNIELHLVRTTKQQNINSVNNLIKISNEESEEEHNYMESEEVDNVLLTPSLDRSSITLICRQPEIHSLAELSQLLQSPSTVLDAEGCVALHTDQILITPELIKLAQGAGLAYYFPDKYDKIELQSGSPRLKGNTSGATSSFSSYANNNKNEENVSNNNESMSGLYSSSGSMWSELITSSHRNALAATLPHVFLTLPPGVRLRYKLLTTRGVPVKDEYSFPLRLHVAERLLLLFDDVNATVLRYQQQKQQQKQQLEWKQNTLSLHFDFAAIKLTSTNETSANVASGLVEAETRLPLRIRMKTVPIKVGQDALVECSQINYSDINTLRASQVRVEMEAVCAAQFKLVIRVNGNESIVNMEVTEEAAVMPGILIQCDYSPQNFAIPAEWTLHDEFIHEHVADNIVTTSKQNHIGTKRLDEIKAISPLTWWQYNSPLTSITRDVTYPAESAIEKASSLVFTSSALAHEKAMKSTRLDVSLKEQQRKEEENFFFHSSTRRKRRRTSRVNVDLSNKHLLHFGLDTSIPFTLHEQNDTDVTKIE